MENEKDCMLFYERLGCKTRHYLSKNADEVTFAYRTTTMSLCKRGFGFTDAKRMVRISGLLDYVEEFQDTISWYHDMSITDTADWVERQMNKTNRIIVDWTGILFE